MSEKLTTAGAILIKHSLPTQKTRNNFDIYTPLDKKAVDVLVSSLLKDGGPEAGEFINGLAKKFFNQATTIGATTPLSDYINDSDEKHAIIREFDTKAGHIMHSNDHKAIKNQKLMNLTGEYNTRIEKQNIDYLISQNSMAAKMAKTGARGNPMQLATGTSSPLMSLNVKGELIPLVIKRSFAEGMKPAEHIALSYMGRSSTVMSQLSTALPGALFKKLAPTVFHEVITIPDCKTKNGIPVSIKDKKNLLGRYTAGTNSLITEPMLAELSMSTDGVIKVRSAMTCEAKDGVCQHCFGLMASGKLPEIGTNIGVIAAQSVSEVLTQAMLGTKHKATVGERKGNIYEQAANLLNNPAENFKDEATISTINGTVSSIKKTPLGATHVYVNEKMHFVPIQQEVKVNIGDKVKPGQALSSGIINPRKLVALRGIGDGRAYLSDKLRDTYPDFLDPRHFEIIAKNLIKYVEVVHPGNTGLIPGDKVDINTIRKYLDKGSKEVPIHQAEGGVLSKGISTLVPGTLLDHNHIQELEQMGYKTIPVSHSGLRIKPIVPGLQTAKMLDKNWVSKLSFSRLRDSLKESAATHSETSIHDTDPIASYMMGSEFGEGKEGKY